MTDGEINGVMALAGESPSSLAMRAGIIAWQLRSGEGTDRGLAEIARASKLKALWISGGNYTLAGLKQLQQLAELKILYVDERPPLPPDWLDELKTVLPNCAINRQ
jgi:hypothetical protein